MVSDQIMGRWLPAVAQHWADVPRHLLGYCQETHQLSITKMDSAFHPSSEGRLNGVVSIGTHPLIGLFQRVVIDEEYGNGNRADVVSNNLVAIDCVIPTE